MTAYTRKNTPDAGLNGKRPDWHYSALCAQTDPEAFFPERGASTKDAKRICGRCPVQDECLDWALHHDEKFGVWGGTSEQDRRKIKRRLA